jgi:hypothetical protein
MLCFLGFKNVESKINEVAEVVSLTTDIFEPYFVLSLVYKLVKSAESVDPIGIVKGLALVFNKLSEIYLSGKSTTKEIVIKYKANAIIPIGKSNYKIKLL